MPSCMCGCGAQVAKRFKQGHDARLKSSLIRSALAPGGDPDALAKLDELGWTKFLDKAKEASRRRALPANTQRALTDEQAKARAEATIATIERMKEAAQALKEAGRYREVTVTRHNWEQILDDPLDYPGDER